MEEQTRKWYPEEFEGIDSDAFVEMMLLDGCFIVELLRLYTKRSKSYQVYMLIFQAIYFFFRNQEDVRTLIIILIS